MLSSLVYHQKTTQYFVDNLSLWQYFANHKQKEDQLQQFKTDLLKNTYKFDISSDSNLFQKVEFVKEKLGLQTNIFLYQAQNTDEVNASIVYLGSEAHIVFSGKLIQMMSDDELTAVIGHELSHIQLYTQMNGAVETTDRIITAIANHQGSAPAFYETARLFKLYTEIFCDRGAYLVMEDYKPIICSLVKISTGLQSVNADSFIKQAEEIFKSDATTKSSGISHPENFIRARALWLWHVKGSSSEQEIQQMIEGNANLDEMDIFKQQSATFITKSIVTLLLQPNWMQTPQIQALGAHYFPDSTMAHEIDKSQISALLQQSHVSVQDYIGYVLYDFATADKSLEDIPLGYCFSLANDLMLEKSFSNAVKKERKLTDKKVSALKKQSLESFHMENKPA